MSISGSLTLLVFLLFFCVVCPLFIYWFNRFLKNALTKGVSFIGFPQDREPPGSS